MATRKLGLKEKETRLAEIQKELKVLSSTDVKVSYSQEDNIRIEALEKEIKRLTDIKESFKELVEDNSKDSLIDYNNPYTEQDLGELSKISNNIKQAQLELSKITEKYDRERKAAEEMIRKTNAQRIRTLKATATRLTNDIKKQALEVEHQRAIMKKDALQVISKKPEPQIHNVIKTTSIKSKIQAKPFPVKLNTTPGQKNGITYRNHEYEVLDKELKKILKNEEIHSVTSLTKMFGKYWKEEGGENDATIFGTTVHRLIEDLEKNGAFGKLKTGKQVTEAEVAKKVTELLKSAKAEDVVDMEGITHNITKGIKYNNTKDQQQARIAKVTANINEYLKLKDSMGLGDTSATMTEKPLGARFKIGDKVINIAGTLDQIFGAMMTDLKTSESLGPEYGLQISLLQTLAAVNGIKVDNTGKIINMPRNGDKAASVVDVTGIDTDDMLKLVDIAVKMKKTTDPEEKLRLHQEGCRILGVGGMSTKVSRGSKGGLLLNGKSIKEWGEYFEQHGGGYQALESLIRNIDSKKDRNAVISTIKKHDIEKVSEQMSDGTTSITEQKKYKYNTNIFDQLRNNSFMFQDNDFLSEGEFGVNIGGDKNFIQWMKTIYRMKPEDRAQYIAKMVNILDSQLAQNDDAEGMMLAMRAIKNMTEHLSGSNKGLSNFTQDEISYYSKLYKFLESGGNIDEWRKLRKEETGFDDFHRLDDIDIGQFKNVNSFIDSRLGAHTSKGIIAQIDTQFSSNRRIAQAMEDVGEVGSYRAATEWTSPMARKALEEKYERFDDRQAQLEEEEWEAENGPINDKHIDGKRLGHLFAIGVESVRFYDQVFNQAWEQYKSEGHNDEYSKDIIKFMGANMTNQQIEQYAASKRLNTAIEQIRSYVGDDWTAIMFELGKQCTDPGYLDTIAGDDPNCRRLLTNLVTRYRESESPDSFSGDSDLVNTLDKHLTQGGKMKTFSETGGGALAGLVMNGLTIGTWYSKPEDQATAVESAATVDDRVTRHQGEAGAGAAKKMASWRKSHFDTSAFYGYSGEGKEEKEASHYYAFYWYVYEDGKPHGRQYLCEVDSTVKRGDHIKAPSKDGKWQHGIVGRLYKTTEEKIREIADDYQGDIKKFGGLWDELAQQTENVSKEESTPIDIQSFDEPSRSSGGGSAVDSPGNLPSSADISSDTGVQVIESTATGGDTVVASASSGKRGKKSGPTTKSAGSSRGRSGGAGGDRLTITHVDSAKLVADTVNVTRVEHIEQNIKNSYHGAGGTSTPKGRVASGSATATAAALGLDGKSERDLQKVQTIYNNILRTDKQIYSNKQSIASLSEDKTEKAKAYKESLIAQNKLLVEQKNRESLKLVDYHKAGIDLSPFGRRYATDLDVYKYGSNIKVSTGGAGGSGKSSGGFKFGGMDRTSWYSLDGRVIHWIERMLNGGMWLGFLNLMKKGLKTLIGLSKELDKSMTNIRIVTGTTREQAQNLTGSFIQLSQKLGVTAEEVLKAATEFYRQGYQTAEVENLVASATKLSRLGMIDMTKSVQDITSAMKGFKLSTEQSIDVVDKLTAIDMKAAVSAGEIAEGLSQFANLANVNGVDIDQAAAYVATIAEVTQKGGSSTGSALKMIMSRYGNVKAGAYNKLNVDTENTDTSQDLNDVEKVLKKLGISIRDTNLNFKDFDVILDEIAERWNDLDNVTKRAIATSFAGTRQQEQFLTLMENYDKYKKLLDVSRNSAGTADKKYESYLDSYEAAKNELQNAVKELANNSQINKILTDVTKGITKVFKDVIPFLMRILPFLMHVLLDIRTLMGKSVIQKVGGQLLNMNSSSQMMKAVGNNNTNWGLFAALGSKSMTERGIARMSEKANAGFSRSAALDSKDANKAKGGGNASAALFGISMLMNSLISAVTAFQTSGATHKTGEKDANDKDIYTESSASAQKKAGSVAAVLAFLPFGIGSLIDGLFGISDKIAANADREKDAAESATKHAETIISSLNNMDTKLTQIESYGIGSDNFNKALNEMLVDLYSKDNKEAREALEDVIGGPRELRSTLNKIKTGTEQQAKAALRTLKIAELEAKKEKIQNKYATQKYNNQTDISKKFAAVNNYEGGNHIGEGIALGLGGSAAGALTGLAAVGLTNAWNPVGVAILLATALAGAGIGIYAGIQNAKASKELEKQKYEKETAWGRMSISQKILDTQEKLDKAIEEGNGEYAGQLQELLDALNTQNALTNQNVDEMNEVALEQAFIGAVYKDEKGNETALQDMSVAQLKNLGVDKILAIYGQAAMDSGIIGQNFFDKDGNLTESGYTYLLPKLRAQGDDEISSVLTGGTYTLREALALKDKFPDSIYVDRLLQSFATSLNTTVDGLGDLEGALGSLHLAETYLSTTELSNELNSYTGLLDSISTGAGNTSEWMNTIINQFPELIAYMGDTSTLFDKITEKVGALSKQYINAQYASVSSSEETYNTIKEDFYKKIDNEDIIAALDKANVASIDGVIEFLRGEYGSDGQLTKTGETVKKALTDTVDEFGLSITSSVLKGYYDKVIEFKTKVLDTEIKNLNEQKEALQNINKQREYENQLIEAKLKLENASKEKKRVYRAGVGWVYEADQEAIAKAQTEYDQLQNQKTVSDLEMQIATLESEKNKLNSIYDEQNYETLSDFYTSYMKTTDESLSLYSNIADGIAGISVNLSELVEGAAKTDKENKDKAVSAAKKAWEKLQGVAPGSAGYNGTDYNTALEAYHIAYNAAVGAGMKEEDTKGWGDSSIAGQSGKQGAWAVGGGTLENQKVSPGLHFKLPDPSDNSKSFEGTADWNSTQYKPKIHEYILKDIKHNKAYIWLPGESTGIKPDDDTRFTYKKDKTFTDYIKRMKEQGINEFVVTGYDGSQESVYVKDDVIYRIVGYNAADDPDGLSRVSGGVSSPVWAEPFYETYAKGTLGVSLVNELGTEAIVTPHGTITALPSRTGVVPADITKNLWELGKVAPSIMRTLELQMRDITLKSSGLGNTDESFNVGTINMTVNADGTFDADAFVESVKMRASLTRNTNR